MEKESLEQEALEQEPEENVWSLPFLKIVWSFILTTITINIKGLQYILPTVGIMLLLTGVRSLKQINQNFHSLWYLAIGKAVLYIINLLILSSPLALYKFVTDSIGILSMILQIAIYLVLRSAIRKVYQNHESQAKRDPLLWASISIVVMTFAFWMSYGQIVLIALILCIFFLSIMSSLYKVSNELYVIDPDAPVEYNRQLNRKIAIAFTSICCLVVVLVCILSNHTVALFVEQAKPKEHTIREELIQLGFPKEIIYDMSDRNVKQLTGAIHVDVQEDVLSFNKKPSLNARTVVIELPDNLLYVVVYFQWNQNKAIWNDGFSIWGEDGFELIDGNLLCERKGNDVVAPINRLSCGTVTTNTIFFGEQQSRQITGTVCFPFNSKNQRGYVFYKLQLPKEQWLGSNCFNYLHFAHPLQLPFNYADQRLLSGSYEYKQHYVNLFTQLYREANPDYNN